MSQALVRIAAGWLMGLMLAVAGAVLAINLVNDSIASPQQPVREYLDALQKGEGEKAWACCTPGCRKATLQCWTAKR